MSSSRREFIKFVVVGSVAAGCPIDKTLLAASHPLDRVFFAHSDSGGPESLTSEAIRLSKAAAECAERVLAGKPGAKELAEKALEAVPD